MRTMPSTPTSAIAMSNFRASAAASRSGLGLLGVEPCLGLLDQAHQLGGTDLVRHRRDVLVDERCRGG